MYVLSVTYYVEVCRLYADKVKLDQRIIDKVIKQWRTCLRACNEAKCGHFEHKL